MAKKEEKKVLTNKTPILLKDYITYRNFAGLLMTKRGINRFFSLLIAVFSLFLFYPLTHELINAVEEERALEIFLFLLGYLPVIAAALFNGYATFTFNKKTMLSRRIGLFLTCLCLSLFFAFQDNDTFITLLIVTLPLASLFGLVYPFISNKKEYEKVKDLSYNYQFLDEEVIISTAKNDNNDNKMRSDYKFVAVFEIGDIFFIFVSPTSALFVSKNGFNIGNGSQMFIELLKKHQVNYSRVKW